MSVTRSTAVTTQSSSLPRIHSLCPSRGTCTVTPGAVAQEARDPGLVHGDDPANRGFVVVVAIVVAVAATRPLLGRYSAANTRSKKLRGSRPSPQTELDCTSQPGLLSEAGWCSPPMRALCTFPPPRREKWQPCLFFRLNMGGGGGNPETPRLRAKVTRAPDFGPVMLLTVSGGGNAVVAGRFLTGALHGL